MPGVQTTKRIPAIVPRWRARVWDIGVGVLGDSPFKKNEMYDHRPRDFVVARFDPRPKLAHYKESNQGHDRREERLDDAPLKEDEKRRFEQADK
jgi:hypothetical protein